jgi:thiol-disulfide isomerase/thioredoxin
MKFSAFIVCLFLLASCAYRNLEGSVKPVYFSTDSVVFADTMLSIQRVGYQNVMGLSFPCLEVVDLRPGEEVKTFIARPTYVEKENVEFLVYPGEHIRISADVSNQYLPAFSTVKKNKVRDRELLMLKTFQELEKKPKMPYRRDPNLLIDYNFQTILDLEKSVQAQVAPAERSSQLLFDSLCTVYHVSRKFRKLTKDYVHNRYDITILGLYQTYRDTLLAHNVYQDKIRALLPLVNGVTKTSEFNSNLARNTSGIYTYMFPDMGIRNMVTTYGGLQSCFDSIIANFNGVARDYLLSRLMFRAYTQSFTIPSDLQKTCRQYSMNKEYRKIIDRAARNNSRAQADYPALPNELLMADGKTKVKLEDVLARSKGRYVVVDLWASWCGPCMEEMPAWQALKKNYSADEIAFLSVSLDKSYLAWKSQLRQSQSDTLSNYFLIHPTNSALTKQIGLTEIPRYLLYDRNGDLVNSDAPRPSDPGLKKMLDKLLLK